MTDIMTKQKDTFPVLNENDVIAWLEKHPSFLQDNPRMLDILTPPQDKQSGKGIADFQHYMVKRLRADRDEILETTREIVENSRANMNNLSRVHNAILMLLEARSFEDFIHTITMDLSAMLDVDIISLVIETDGVSIPQINLTGVRAAAPGTIDFLMKDRGIILESQITGYEEIYSGGAGLVKSQALVRLDIIPGTPPALLAFGSRNPDLFNAGQATDLLAFLGKVIERRFRSWLEHP